MKKTDGIVLHKLHMIKINKCKNIECKNETKSKNVYCSQSCRTIFTNKTLKDYSKTTKFYEDKRKNLEDAYYLDPKYCLHCKTMLIYSKRKRIHCSSSCSAKTNNPKRIGSKHSHSELGLKSLRAASAKIKNKNTLDYNQNPNLCMICHKSLTYNKRLNKVCSKKCRSLSISNQCKDRGFGGETNFKKFYYNDVWFDSSWEVEVAKFLDNRNITWIRSKTINFIWIDQNNVSHKYYPDFYLPDFNLYLDPKNSFKLKSDQYKLTTVINTHNIKLLYGNVNTIFKQLNILLNI